MASVTAVARTCHEANRAICEAFGAQPEPTWDEATEEQRENAKTAACHALNAEEAPINPGASVLQRTQLLVFRAIARNFTR